MLVSTFALSTEMTRLRRARAASKALCAIRSICRREYSFVSQARSSAPEPSRPLAAGRCAKYAPPVSSSHHEDVESVAYDVGPQRAGRSERLVDFSRTQVAVQIEVLAQREKRRPFWLPLWRQRLPLGATNRSEENGLTLLARLQRRRRQRLAMPIDGGAADVHLPDGCFEVELAAGGLDHPDRLFHHFRTNAVAGEHRDCETFIRSELLFSRVQGCHSPPHRRRFYTGAYLRAPAASELS